MMMVVEGGGGVGEGKCPLCREIRVISMTVLPHTGICC